MKWKLVRWRRALLLHVTGIVIGILVLVSLCVKVRLLRTVVLS